jgi:ATP phosphoribosyltransferase regulatory subunit
VLHTRPSGLGSREPLQFGAEIFGHAGLEADLEVQELALDVLQAAHVEGLVIDLADARVVRGVLAGLPVDAAQLQQVVAALSNKDAAEVEALSRGFTEQARRALRALLGLYGDEDMLDAARRQLPARALITEALNDLQWLASHLRRVHPDVRIGFDLSDMSGYAYYSGTRFAVYGGTSSDALARGGRYDEVGAVFGRRRPAVGFSLDLKMLAELGARLPRATAVRAPWGEDFKLRDMVRSLREGGETVLCILPGHEHESQEFAFDRELVAVDNQWVLRSL